MNKYILLIIIILICIIFKLIYTEYFTIPDNELSIPKYTLNNISVYILNWKKVTNNSLKLYEKISPIIKNTWIINCDEFTKLDSNIPHIQLDDSHYYGSQYDHAIKHVKNNNIFCVIVGDNITDNNFKKIFNSAINAFNNYNIGVYSPNDKRSPHKARGKQIDEYLYDVYNTDCGFWFIHPVLVKKLKNINYNISKYGWGIDIITIKEARKQNLLVLRDYSIETDQLDHSCGYDNSKAAVGLIELEKEYNLL
jgi:hypothetical protein